MSAQRPTPDEFWNTIVPRHEPAVWRGAVSDMEIVKLARDGADPLLDRLSATCGDRRVHVTGCPPSAEGKMGFHETLWPDWSRRGSTFDAFIADLRTERAQPSGHCAYMQSAPIGSALPELLPLTSIWLADEQRMQAESRQLWMGSGGQRLAVHQDSTHSIICMVSGHKEFILFPPDQHRNLYTAPQGRLFEWPWRSRVDPRRPDLERYPRFADALAASRTIRIGPGDVLFLPAYWWHSVDSFGLNIMFNSRWLDVEASRLDDVTAAFAHGVVSARTLPPSLQERLRSEISTHALGDEVESALDDQERAPWIDALRAGTAVRASASARTLDWDRELELGPDVVATMGEAGVCLRNDDTGATRTLDWDFAPVLEQFGRPRTPADALRALQEQFDVDAAVLGEQLVELVAGGILVCTDPRQRTDDETRLRATVAHTVLAARGLPLHHRRALRYALEIFAFLREGEPYPETEPAHRGVLGVPMLDANRRYLEGLVRERVQQRFGEELVPDDSWETPYRLDHTRSMTVGAGGLVLVGTSEQTLLLPWHEVEVLSEFREPRRPADVFAEIDAQWDTTQEQFRALVTRWIAWGALVPVERAAEANGGGYCCRQTTDHSAEQSLLALGRIHSA
ncbi:MAG: cupin-like domain-containing protein [Myxococcota bacterium]